MLASLMKIRATRMLLLLLCVFSTGIEFSQEVKVVATNGVNGRTNPQSSSRIVTDPSLQGHEIPDFKMMKRQIRNFRKGETASVTLVFHASLPVTVRWYTSDRRNIAAHSEIPNMFPAEGNEKYKVTKMSSGDVTATSLLIPKFSPGLPASFECIISTEAGTLQYQIKTLVKKPVSFELDNIDSPEWMLVPRPTWNFTLFQQMQIKCKVFVPFQKSAFANVLTLLYNGLPIMKKDNKIQFEPIFTIHTNSMAYAEEEAGGSTILQGETEALNNGHAFYEVRLTTSNTTVSFEGMYMCRVIRQYDKFLFLSAALVTGSISPYPSEPRVQLINCKTGLHWGSESRAVVLVEGEPACIRCQGVGYPPPIVNVYRGQSIVTPDTDVFVNKFTNVADAGAVEAIYIFRKPSSELIGNYRCRASNSEGEDGGAEIRFRVLVKSTNPYTG